MKSTDPVAAFFEDYLTLESCKERLIMIADAYMEASSQHNQEWEEEKVRQEWAISVRATTSSQTMVPFIT